MSGRGGFRGGGVCTLIEDAFRACNMVMQDVYTSANHSVISCYINVVAMLVDCFPVAHNKWKDNLKGRFLSNYCLHAIEELITMFEYQRGGGGAGSTGMGRGRNDLITTGPPVTFPERSVVQTPLLITAGMP